MTRHIHADLIHAWAEGAEIESRRSWGQFGWTTTKNPEWDAAGMEFRIKPEEPEWYENIPKQGVLCWVSDYNENLNKQNIRNILAEIIDYDSDKEHKYLDFRGSRWKYAVPLTNEEIEEFKR